MRANVLRKRERAARPEWTQREGRLRPRRMRLAEKIRLQGPGRRLQTHADGRIGEALQHPFAGDIRKPRFGIRITAADIRVSAREQHLRDALA
ncbi:hypothetical protein [Caballeronia sp. AZ7_KS35]|uniref:hypothetical protein n=1 Tax=Caballeronia sp. AZ7_KS35 TaxID=2921762 RepID=UPI002028DA1B|nr:hypothetical protein [Caballeronia sp. AZ7_KS35]